MTLLPALCLTVLVAPQGPFVSAVSTAKIRRHVFEPQVEVLGEIRSPQTSTLGAEVAGPVVEILVGAGTPVEKGQLLLRIRTKGREIRRRSAAAALERARQQLAEYEAGSREEEVREAREAHAEASALLDEAARELARVEGLHSGEVASERELTAARSAAAAARAVLGRRKASLDRVLAGPRPELVARARQEVAVRTAELDEVDDEIDRSAVRAPFAGVVSEKRASLGQYLRVGDAVFTLVQLDPIEAIVPVTERDVGRISPGMKVSLHVAGRQAQPVDGQVLAVVPRGDPRARSFPVRVGVANAEHRLLPGMSVRASIRLAGGAPSLAVPTDAIVSGPLGAAVYVIRDGKAERVRVKLGSSAQGLRELEGELREGEVVATKGNESLRPGAPVRVVEEVADKRGADK